MYTMVRSSGSVLVKVIAMLLVALVALVILYFGGRRLLSPPEIEDNSMAAQRLPVVDDQCGTDTTYESLQAALDKRDTACVLAANEKGLAIVSDEIGYLEELRELNLSDNTLTELPSQISYLRNLRASADWIFDEIEKGWLEW
jgi:hypothetical protein